jgi:tRNA pseudouridine13 synthase
MLGDLVLNSEGNPEYVTEENKSQYTLHDIVLPLPGHSILYPKYVDTTLLVVTSSRNDIFESMKEIMVKDGLDIDAMERKQFLFSLPGGYRNLIEKAEDFNFEIRKYTEYHEQLALTDLDACEK